MIGGGGGGGADSATPMTSTTTAPTTFNQPSDNNSTAAAAPTVVSRKVAVLGFRGVGKSSIVTQFVTPGTFSERYDPTIESTQHKTIRFRRVHFATDIVDTAGVDEFFRLSRNAGLGGHGDVLVFSITSKQSFALMDQLNNSLLNSLGDLPDVPRVLVGTKLDLCSASSSTESDDDENASTSSSSSSPIKTRNIYTATNIFSSGGKRMMGGRGSYTSGGSHNHMVAEHNNHSNGSSHHSNNDNSSVGNSSAGGGAGGKTATATRREVDVKEARMLAQSWGNVPYLECSSKTGVGVADVFHTLLKEIEKDDGLLVETKDGMGCTLM